MIVHMQRFSNEKENVNNKQRIERVTEPLISVELSF